MLETDKRVLSVDDVLRVVNDLKNIEFSNCEKFYKLNPDSDNMRRVAGMYTTDAYSIVCYRLCEIARKRG